MDYELKYKNALEWARMVMKGETGFIREEVVEVFPELAESEDEMIRKALIRFHHSTINIDGIKGEEILAWLEKQGETREMMGNQGKISPKWINKAYGWLIERYENQGVILLGDINELKQVLEEEQ